MNGDKPHCRRVHAVAKTGWRRAVIEDVAEVRVALNRADFTADNSHGPVHVVLQVIRFQRTGEARPTGPGFELVGGAEKWLAGDDIHVDTRVTLTVYDVLGREIVRLAQGDYEPGRHEVVFDARSVASGLYIARLVAETEDGSVATKVRRMTLLK